jgi:hypothetical protein
MDILRRHGFEGLKHSIRSLPIDCLKILASYVHFLNMRHLFNIDAEGRRLSDYVGILVHPWFIRLDITMHVDVYWMCVEEKPALSLIFSQSPGLFETYVLCGRHTRRNLNPRRRHKVSAHHRYLARRLWII